MSAENSVPQADNFTQRRCFNLECFGIDSEAEDEEWAPVRNNGTQHTATSFVATMRNFGLESDIEEESDTDPENGR